MPRTKKTKPEQVPPSVSGSPPVGNGPPEEVLTLSEAAAYLRLPEQEVVRLVREQDLPARHVGTDWRFFKRAIQEWLSQPPSKASKAGLWDFAGAWKDDPYAEEMLKEIWSRRGQPVPED